MMKLEPNEIVSTSPPARDLLPVSRSEPQAESSQRSDPRPVEDNASRRARAAAERSSRDPGRRPDAKAAVREVSETKVANERRLPQLEDDADVGVEKEQIVPRDGKPDLAFVGTLLATAAANTPTRKGHWREYRIYTTAGGKHVFSRVDRTIFADEEDQFAAEIFDPAPSSVPSQLMRSAREMARSRTLTWMDAAVGFFGYDPLAKALYRKLSVRFEEQIS